MRAAYFRLFREGAKGPIVQFVVSGPYAFISENFSEALIEKDFLFTGTASTPAQIQALDGTKRVIKAL